MKTITRKTIGVLLALLLTFSAFGALAFPAAAAEAGHELIIQCLGYQMIVSCPNGQGCTEIPTGAAYGWLADPGTTTYGDGMGSYAQWGCESALLDIGAVVSPISYWKKVETNDGVTWQQLGGAAPVDAGDYKATVNVSIEGKSYTLETEYSIAKATIPAEAVTAPTAKEGLVFNGQMQDLVTAGSTTVGSMLYKVDDGEFSAAVPQAMDVGVYTVSYYADGGSNYKSTAVQTLTVTITADKTELQTAISGAETYYNTIKDAYPDAAAALKTAIDAAAGVDSAELAPQADVDAAKAALDSAVTTAEIAVANAQAEAQAAADAAAAVEEKIAAIGDVTYTDESKAKIDDAQAAYDALTDAQKQLVENADVLTAAQEKYAELKAEAEKPTEPETSASEGPGVCELCGETHDVSTISGFFTDFMHDILYVLKQLTVGFLKFIFS